MIFPDKEQRLQKQAADWFVRLRSCNFDEDVVAQYQKWLDEDESRKAECQKIQDIWQDTDIAQSAALAHLQTLEQRNEPVGWFGGVSIWQWSAAATACLLFITIAGLAVYNGLAPGVHTVEARLYTTDPGERSSVLLMDGSTLFLNGASTVEVRMMTDERHVNLLNGEALFVVEKDPDRPFSVFARGIQVRAVGTQFNVNLIGEKVDVTVIEGIVAVAGFPDNVAKRAVPQEIRLSIGQQLSYRKNSASPDVSFAQVDRVMAWQERKIYFDKASLDEVIEKLGRNYPGKFKVLAPSTMTQSVSGVFEVGDLDSTLKALELVLPVRFERQSEQLVHVYSTEFTQNSQLR